MIVYNDTHIAAIIMIDYTCANTCDGLVPDLNGVRSCHNRLEVVSAGG